MRTLFRGVLAVLYLGCVARARAQYQATTLRPGLMLMATSKRPLAIFGLMLIVAIATAQSFNIDIDDPGAPPELGGGVPSDAFGAAANQRGYWNSVRNVGPGPFSLRSLSGATTDVQLSVLTEGVSFGGRAYRFEGNTGDYAKLLNDAARVGTLVQGGRLTYSFVNLAAGVYDVYTYAVNVSGDVGQCPVFSPEGDEPRTQVVTGPMPGNSFGLLITHSTHNIILAQGQAIHIIITQPPMGQHEFDVNGFQIESVPETEPCLVILIGLLALGASKSKFAPRP